MRFSTTLALAASVFTTAALAAPHKHSSATAVNATSFYLVTTSSCEQAAQSSDLPDVNATNVYDPWTQPSFPIAQYPPSEAQGLYKFGVSDTGLFTLIAPIPYGERRLTLRQNQPDIQYNCSNVASGQKLIMGGAGPTGDFGLQDGYLITLGGQSEGWTVCPAHITSDSDDTPVITWQGTATGCKPVYLQAVNEPPYGSGAS